MKKIIAILLLSIFAAPALAQTTNTTTNTTTSNTAVDGSTNVIVSTPNGTIGNQVNSPANSNNVYVVNGKDSSGDTPREYRGRYLDDLDRDELIQRRNDRDYERARQSHDYRDRPNYYNIRENQNRQFNDRNRGDSRSNYHSRTRRTSR